MQTPRRQPTAAFRNGCRRGLLLHDHDDLARHRRPGDGAQLRCCDHGGRHPVSGSASRGAAGPRRAAGLAAPRGRRVPERSATHPSPRPAASRLRWTTATSERPWQRGSRTAHPPRRIAAVPAIDAPTSATRARREAKAVPAQREGGSTSDITPARTSRRRWRSMFKEATVPSICALAKPWSACACASRSRSRLLVQPAATRLVPEQRRGPGRRATTRCGRAARAHVELLCRPSSVGASCRNWSTAPAATCRWSSNPTARHSALHAASTRSAT